MGICTYEAEGIDPHDVQPIAFRQRHTIDDHCQLGFFKGNIWVRRLEVQIRGDFSVLEREQHFSDSSDAGRGFKMSYV